MRATQPPKKRSGSLKLQDVVSEDLCVGCGVCCALPGGNSIEMKYNEHGFLRPQIAGYAAIAVKQLKAVCPGINVTSEGPRTSDIWGVRVVTAVGHANDPDVRRLASSGGVISAVTKFLLQSGVVDAVVCTRSHPSDPTRNTTEAITNVADLDDAAGSRYSPSAPLERIEEFLSEGRRIAFIGKPCDVNALRKYLTLRPEYKQQVKYLISFFCAGVPSRKATHKAVATLGLDPEKLQSLKYRGDGWPGKFKATSTDGKVGEMSYQESWGTILNQDIQFRCKICPDGIGEAADLVCGDAWYGEGGYPSFEEKDGRSLIVARNHLGVELLTLATEGGAITIDTGEKLHLSDIQPYQFERRTQAIGRLWGAILGKRTQIRNDFFHLLSLALQGNFRKLPRTFVGAVVRARKERMSRGN